MKKLLLLVFVTACLTSSLYAQKDTVVVKGMYSGGTEGSLNDAIQKAKDDGTISNTVFKLNAPDLYVLTSAITTNIGQNLEIVAPKPGNTQQTAPAQIAWTATGGVATDYNFQLYGDITMKNVWLRYATTEGKQVGSTFQIANDSTTGATEKADFDGVIFDYSGAPPDGSGAVSVTAKHFVGTFKNCYFRNDIDRHLRYYGRALSFPYQTSGWHVDSVLFENTTFANMGYVYMQEGGEYGDNVHFNHCTFLNIMMFSLESGWWHNMSVTNSVFVNPFMYGNIPAQGDPNGGIFAIARWIRLVLMCPSPMRTGRYCWRIPAMCMKIG